MKRFIAIVLAWTMMVCAMTGAGVRADGTRCRGASHRECHTERHIDAGAFSRLLDLVNSQSFDDGKMLVIEAASLGAWFNCSQAATLMSCFKWDDEKLKVLGFLAPRLTDLREMEIVFAQFDFDSSKEKAWKLIASPCVD